MRNAKKQKAVLSMSTDGTAQLDHRVEKEHEIQEDSESSLVVGTDHDEAALCETIEQTCQAADTSMNYNIGIILVVKKRKKKKMLTLKMCSMIGSWGFKRGQKDAGIVFVHYLSETAENECNGCCLGGCVNH